MQKVLQWLSDAWTNHGTKLLGTAGAIIPGLIAIDGLVSADHRKYWLATNVIIGALTVRRGFVNSAQQ